MFNPAAFNILICSRTSANGINGSCVPCVIRKRWLLRHGEKLLHQPLRLKHVPADPQPVPRIDADSAPPFQSSSGIPVKSRTGPLSRWETPLPVRVKQLLEHFPAAPDSLRWVSSKIIPRIPSIIFIRRIDQQIIQPGKIQRLRQPAKTRRAVPPTRATPPSAGAIFFPPPERTRFQACLNCGTRP